MATVLEAGTAFTAVIFDGFEHGLSNLLIVLSSCRCESGQVCGRGLRSEPFDRIDSTPPVRVSTFTVTVPVTVTVTVTVPNTDRCLYTGGVTVVYG